MRQRVLERCGWQFFRVRGGEYYSNRKKALEPLWKLLSANDFHKEDPPINNNHQHNRQEEIIIEVVETVQLETKRQTVVSNKKVVQPDLFRTESQVAMTFTNEAEQPTKMKAATHLLSFPEILVFTSQHNVYKVANRGLTSQSQVISQIEFEEGEKSIYFTGTKNYSGYLIVAFQNGKAGKISMTAFQTEHNRKKLKNAFSDESKLIFIEHIENDIDLVALSSINKVVLFNTSKINPVGSRTTKGVQVMKQKDNSFMTKIKRLNQVKLQDAEYYRKDESLNVVGYYLKLGDEI
jgi:DNA gyrase/topoisomerase IV subunit A